MPDRLLDEIEETARVAEAQGVAQIEIDVRDVLSLLSRTRDLIHANKALSNAQRLGIDDKDEFFRTMVRASRENKARAVRAEIDRTRLMDALELVKKSIERSASDTVWLIDRPAETACAFIEAELKARADE